MVKSFVNNNRRGERNLFPAQNRHRGLRAQTQFRVVGFHLRAGTLLFHIQINNHSDRSAAGNSYLFIMLLSVIVPAILPA